MVSQLSQWGPHYRLANLCFSGGRMLGSTVHISTVHCTPGSTEIRVGLVHNPPRGADPGWWFTRAAKRLLGAGAASISGAARSRTQGSFTWPPPGHRPRVMWKRRRLLQIACQPRLTATMASRQTGVQIDGRGHRCARCPRGVDEGAAIAAGPDRPNRAKAARLRPQKGRPWSASADNRRRRCIVARCE